MYDATGRLVLNETHTLGAGVHELPIDGSGWASGAYFAKVRANGVSATRAMRLVK